METKLFQKQNFLYKNWFEIQDEGLWVKRKRINNTDEYFMSFEELGVNIFKSKGKNLGPILATILLFALSIGIFIYEKSGSNTEKGAWLFYLILGLISCTISILTFRRTFFLTTARKTNSIEFFTNQPSEESVKNYVANLKAVRNKYLVEKYGNLTKLLSYEKQYDTLHWLNSINAMSNVELQDKLAELNKLFKSSDPIAGFHNSNN
jgi:hypothetical protein